MKNYKRGEGNLDVIFYSSGQSASQFTTSTNAVEFQCITFDQALNRTMVLVPGARNTPKEY